MPVNSNQPSDDATESLIRKHFEDHMTAAEEQKLAAALSTSDSSRELFLSYMRLEGRLHSLGRDGLLLEPATDNSLKEIDGKSQKSSFSSSRRTSPPWRVLLSLAAMLVLMFVVSWSLSPEPLSAHSILERAKLAAAEWVDRTYLLKINDLMLDGPNRVREFEIDMRGDGVYLVRPLNKGTRTGMRLLGNSGTEQWFSRKNSSTIFTTGDYQSLSPELKKKVPNLGVANFLTSRRKAMLLDIASLLNYVNKTYEVEFVESEQPNTRHLRATPIKNKALNLIPSNFGSTSNRMC